MDILAALEQMDAFLRDFSPVLMAYHKQLIAQGFTEEQAFQLVRDYQMTTLQNSKS